MREERDRLRGENERFRAAVPKWFDPYTNNGDRRPDWQYRFGWNAAVKTIEKALLQGKEGA